MYKMAANGNQFVLTQKGYDATPDNVKQYREVGKPIYPQLGFDTTVPASWVKNGWVEEAEI